MEAIKSCGFHRLCRSAEPETGSTVMAYDGANNLAWSAAGLSITGTGCGQEQVAAGVKTTRSYDAMNRLLTLQPPAGTQSTVYTYDALGQPKTAVSGISTWSATYNQRGMLTSETLQLSGQPAMTLGYAHDAYGHLGQLTYPDGETVAYAPDALGRPTQVGSYASGLAWFPNGELAQLAFANGTSLLVEQNARQLLRNRSYGAGSTLYVSLDYGYDKNGNATQVTDLVNGLRSSTQGYDALDRLTSATAPALWGTETYTYDPLNNLRSRTTAGQATAYVYDTQNRLSALTGAGATSYGYDTRGNLTSQGGVVLAYDAKNQLLGQPGVSYAYDAAGRRVRKTVNGTDTYYFYSQAGELLHQWEPASNKTTNFIRLGHSTLARAIRVNGATPTIIYSYTDAQNTPLVRANAQGAVTASFGYTPYGRIAIGGPPNGAGYTGHVNDPETGLVYMQQRYYDPVSGRFLSVDPVAAYDNGDMRFFNRYAYAFDNPYAFKDYDGRCPVCVVIAVRFVVGAGIDVATQHFVEGKDWGDVDIGDAAIAGVVSTALPGAGNLVKHGYRGAKIAAPAVRAIAKVAAKKANTFNRAAKNAATIARNVEKVEEAAADVGKAAAVAGAHQVVEAAAQSNTPEVKASDIRNAVQPPPPPPPNDKRLNHWDVEP